MNHCAKKFIFNPVTLTAWVLLGISYANPSLGMMEENASTGSAQNKEESKEEESKKQEAVSNSETDWDKEWEILRNQKEEEIILIQTCKLDNMCFNTTKTICMLQCLQTFLKLTEQLEKEFDEFYANTHIKMPEIMQKAFQYRKSSIKTHEKNIINYQVTLEKEKIFYDKNKKDPRECFGTILPASKAETIFNEIREKNYQEIVKIKEETLQNSLLDNTECSKLSLQKKLLDLDQLYENILVFLTKMNNHNTEKTIEALENETACILNQYKTNKKIKSHIINKEKFLNVLLEKGQNQNNEENTITDHRNKLGEMNKFYAPYKNFYKHNTNNLKKDLENYIKTTPEYAQKLTHLLKTLEGLTDNALSMAPAEEVSEQQEPTLSEQFSHLSKDAISNKRFTMYESYENTKQKIHYFKINNDMFKHTKLFVTQYTKQNEYTQEWITYLLEWGKRDFTKKKMTFLNIIHRELQQIGTEVSENFPWSKWLLEYRARLQTMQEDVTNLTFSALPEEDLNSMEPAQKLQNTSEKKEDEKKEDEKKEDEKKEDEKKEDGNNKKKKGRRDKDTRKKTKESKELTKSIAETAETLLKNPDFKKAFNENPQAFAKNPPKTLSAETFEALLNENTKKTSDGVNTKFFIKSKNLRNNNLEKDS